MTVKLLSTVQRPNIDVPWSPFGNDYRWYMNNQYFVDTWHEKGRLLSMTHTNNDGITINSVMEFSDWQALNDFIEDTTLNEEIRTPRTTYFTTSGIEITNLETVEV